MSGFCLRAAAALHNIILCIQDAVDLFNFWNVRSDWLPPPLIFQPQKKRSAANIKKLQLKPDCDFNGNSKLSSIHLFLQASLLGKKSDYIVII